MQKQIPSPALPQVDLRLARGGQDAVGFLNPEMIDWFRLKLTDDTVTLIVTPPGHSDWTAVFAWADIVRVCFEPGDWLQSDTLYILISQRSESYVIPLEANGGLDFWQALISRGLFEADLAIRVATATAGLYCWPEAEA